MAEAYGGYVPLMVRVDTTGYTVAAGRGSVGNLLVMRVDAQGAVLSSQQFNELNRAPKRRLRRQLQPGMAALPLRAESASQLGP